MPPAAAPTTALRAAALVRAAHAPPAFAVTVFAGAYAGGAAGAAAGRALLVAAAVLAGQLSVGWSNDWIDADRDLAVGRRDKPVVAGTVTVAALRRAALLALAACAALSLALGPAAALLHLALVAIAWAYNARLKSTVWSWLPYAVAFGGLPSVATLGVPGGDVLGPWWVTAGGALLGVGAHLANVLPDLEDDAATGVRGLPHRLGRRRTASGAACILLAAVTVVALGPPGAPGAATVAGLALAVGLAASGAAVGLARPASRWPFGAAMAVAAVAVVLLVVQG
ncbi:UbiA family prenyltransferase [Cellulosimicrobium cellulans]|uniref:UbiA family prenyltransferase n=1 Tax=Cellulosimicrobium cellulans TaxID=1710 RepID=UPI00130E670E|nr:UbiA family prenyltransferase [Cellulosimicrobium cellulans]